MAYTIHATGKTVTVAAAEKFQKETGFKISTGYASGGWFCFKMGPVANFKQDVELLKKYFSGALIENVKQRRARIEAFVTTQPPVPTKPYLSEEEIMSIAKQIKAKFPDIKDMWSSEVNTHPYTTKQTNCYDFYALQTALKSIL